MTDVKQLTKPNLLAFENITKSEFLGKPAITKVGNARFLFPSLLIMHDDCPRQPFLNAYRTRHFLPDRGLTAVYDKSGAAVFDGDKVIASYHFGDHLVVDRAYRREGIGAELVYQFRTRYPDTPPAKTRTKASQALQVKVWHRIEMDMLQLKWAREAAEEVANQKALVKNTVHKLI